MAQQYNATGINGRDCPVCYRVGALKGDSTLECLGCATRFSFTAPRTLTRLPSTAFERAIDAVSKFNPADVLKPGALDQVTGGAVTYREPIDMVCRVCGRKHCGGHPQERGVGR